MTTSAAVKEEFRKLCEEQRLHESLAAGRLRHIDAAKLVLRLMNDFEVSPRVIKTRIVAICSRMPRRWGAEATSTPH